MKAAFFSYLRDGERGVLKAKRPSSATATDMIGSQPLPPSPCPQRGTEWAFTFSSSRQTSERAPWLSLFESCSVIYGDQSSSFGMARAFTEDLKWRRSKSCIPAYTSSAFPHMLQNSTPSSRSGTTSRVTLPMGFLERNKTSDLHSTATPDVSETPRRSCGHSSWPQICPIHCQNDFLYFGEAL